MTDSGEIKQIGCKTLKIEDMPSIHFRRGGGDAETIENKMKLIQKNDAKLRLMFCFVFHPGKKNNNVTFFLASVPLAITALLSCV